MVTQKTGKGGEEEGDVKDNSSKFPLNEMGNTEREAGLKGTSLVWRCWV